MDTNTAEQDRTEKFRAQTAAARRELEIRAAYRALDDPAALRRAVRIVRAGVARQRVVLSDLTPLPEPRSKAAS